VLFHSCGGQAGRRRALFPPRKTGRTGWGASSSGRCSADSLRCSLYALTGFSSRAARNRGDRMGPAGTTFATMGLCSGHPMCCTSLSRRYYRDIKPRCCNAQRRPLTLRGERKRSSAGQEHCPLLSAQLSTALPSLRQPDGHQGSDARAVGRRSEVQQSGRHHLRVRSVRHDADTHPPIVVRRLLCAFISDGLCWPSWRKHGLPGQAGMTPCDRSHHRMNR
jgi:hypothetical protein